MVFSFHWFLDLYIRIAVIPLAETVIKKASIKPMTLNNLLWDFLFLSSSFFSFNGSSKIFSPSFGSSPNLNRILWQVFYAEAK